MTDNLSAEQIAKWRKGVTYGRQAIMALCDALTEARAEVGALLNDLDAQKAEVARLRGELVKARETIATLLPGSREDAIAASLREEAQAWLKANDPPESFYSDRVTHRDTAAGIIRRLLTESHACCDRTY